MHGKKPVLHHVLMHGLLIGLSLLFLIPLFWMLSTSLKPIEETMTDKPVWIPRKQLEHKFRDPANPLYETEYMGTKVQGTIASQANSSAPEGRGEASSDAPSLPQSGGKHADPSPPAPSPPEGRGGGVPFYITDPAKYRGVTITAERESLVETDRVGKMASAQVGGATVEGYTMRTQDDETTIGILTPKDKVGETVVVKTSEVKPIYETAPQWQNYKEAISYGEESLGYKPFVVYARNTLLVCILTVFGTVISNALVAYSFSRLRWKGREFMFAVTLATMMIPFPVLMVPIFSLFVKLDWVGTFRPLWVPAWFGSAFSIFLLRQFFRTIPFELSEAAKLDGCSEWAIFSRIVAPLAKPALAVVALFSFMGAWNDFLGPLIYLHSQDQFTLAVGLQFYRSQQANQWHLLMAATTVVVAPVMLLFFFTQRLFMQGIAATGLKG